MLKTITESVIRNFQADIAGIDPCKEYILRAQSRQGAPKSFESFSDGGRSQMVVKGLTDHLSAVIRKNIAAHTVPSVLAAISCVGTIERATSKSTYHLSSLAVASKMYESSPIDEVPNYETGFGDFLQGGQGSTVEWFHLLRGRQRVITRDGPGAILRVGSKIEPKLQIKQIFFETNEGETL